MNIMKFYEMLSVEQGWINVKIDTHLKDRIFKYVELLDKDITNKSLKFDLKYKLEKLLEFKNSQSMQDKITYIVILQYFKEIKDNFDGPAGGLLMEEILSCLVYGDRIPGNKKEDFIAKNAKKFITRIETDDNIEPLTVSYQVKFYTRGNFIKRPTDDKLCDNTVICIRDNRSGSNKIHICFLEKHEIDSYSTTSGISTSQLSDSKVVRKVILDFDKIENILDDIGDDIKDSIKIIYDNLAKLHDTVDDIMLGNKNKITEVKSITDIIKLNLDQIIK
jgi:hypothetical protein